LARAHEHTASTFILRSPAEFARSAGVDVERVLRSHGIAPETLDVFGARVPAVAAMAAWSELAARSGDPDFGLHLAERESIGAYDVLGYIVRSSPQLGHGIEQFGRYERLLGDAWRLRFRVEGATAVFVHEFLVPVADPRHIVEHNIALVTRRVREFTHTNWHPNDVGFRHRAPASTSTHERLFGCTVRFGELTDAIRFDTAALSLTMPMTDIGLASVLERYALQALARMPPPGAYAASVRAVLVELLNEGGCNATVLARKLRSSSRTLQRRLAEEGTTLRELMDGVRRELAEEYLAKPWMSLEQIALLLGFADASGFTHAFRRWTGRAPVDYRRERVHTLRVER
jgi:AraC-like DNA-binding protein